MTVRVSAARGGEHGGAPDGGPPHPCNPVVACVADRADRARISGALRGWREVEFCDGAAALQELVRTRPVAIVLIDLWDGEGRSTADTIAWLRRRLPRMPVVACCPPTEQTACEMLPLSRSGVNGLVVRGSSDTGVALRSALTRAEDDCLSTLVARQLRSVTTEPVVEIVARCVALARQGADVAQVARDLGVHRRTLINRLTAAGAPGPAALIAWARILVATQILSCGGCSVAGAALAAGYPSGSAYRNALRRHTGLTATGLAVMGGLDYLLRLLQRALAPAARGA